MILFDPAYFAYSCVCANRTADRINRPAHARQHGTALVMALVILLILTVLGISSMNTSIMEERMSGNIQDLNRAFESAESGLTKGINAPGAFDLTGEKTNDFTFGTGPTATKATVVTKFIGTSNPKPGTGYGLRDYQAANFDQGSTGTTSISEIGAKVELHQGVGQIISKSQ